MLCNLTDEQRRYIAETLTEPTYVQDAEHRGEIPAVDILQALGYSTIVTEEYEEYDIEYPLTGNVEHRQEYNYTVRYE